MSARGSAARNRAGTAAVAVGWPHDGSGRLAGSAAPERAGPYPERRVLPPRARHLRAQTFAALFAWLAIWASGGHATVTAHLEPDIVDELETTRLILVATGTSPGTPDLTALSGDFEVLGTQTVSKYRSVNGSIEASVEYQIGLRPTRTGELTVPPIAIGGAQSPPLTLVVRPVDPALRAAIDRMVFFEVELTRNPVYVRGETVLIRRLYYSSATQIYSDLPGAPELSGALVLPVGDPHSTTAVRDGERYGVIEQRFAIYPERPGTLTIPSISLTSSVRLQLDGRQRRTGARVSTPVLDVEVLPVPQAYPDDVPWLPATAVEVRDDWSPDRATVQVGEPLERRIAVTVAGNMAAAIPPPDERLPERYFRQYPEPAVLEDDRSGASVSGTRRTDYAIVPTSAGTADLPALAITWWDVDAGVVRTTRSTARTLSIVGVEPAPTDATPQSSEHGVTPSTARTEPVAPAAQQEPAQPRWIGRGVLLALALAAVVLLARHVRRVARGAPRKLRPLLDRTGLTGAQRGLGRHWQLRRLRRDVEQSCRSGDPAALEQALHRYLACWYRTTPTRAMALFRDAGAGPLLDRLQAARFGSDSHEPPAADAVLAALMQLRPAPAPVRGALPELYERA